MDDDKEKFDNIAIRLLNNSRDIWFYSNHKHQDYKTNLVQNFLNNLYNFDQ